MGVQLEPRNIACDGGLVNPSESSYRWRSFRSPVAQGPGELAMASARACGTRLLLCFTEVLLQGAAHGGSKSACRASGAEGTGDECNTHFLRYFHLQARLPRGSLLGPPKAPKGPKTAHKMALRAPQEAPPRAVLGRCGTRLLAVMDLPLRE